MNAALLLASLLAVAAPPKKAAEYEAFQTVALRAWNRYVDFGRRRTPGEVFLPLNMFRARTLRYDNERGAFVDAATGAPLTAEETRRRYSEENPPTKSYLTAGIELSLTLGAYSAWYIYDGFRAPSDWEFPATFNGFYRRNVALEGVRLDNNHPRYNSPGHPLAGAFYFGIGRVNGLSSLESVAMATLASGYWEAIAEMREVMSINDMVTTPFGGAPIAEAVHQVGQYCLRAEVTAATVGCMALFGGASWLHTPITRDRYAPTLDVDRWGFPRDQWHLFRAGSLGGARVASSVGRGQAQVDFHAEAEVIPVTGFRVSDAPVNKLYLDTAATHLVLRGSTGAQIPSVLVDYVQFYAKTVWAAALWQRQMRNPDGTFTGMSAMVGPSSMFEHWEKDITEFWQYDGRNDFISTTGVLGLTGDLALNIRGMSLRLVADLHPTMTSARSLAWERYVALHGDTGTKSSLRRHRYTWSLGVSSQLRAVLTLTRLELGSVVKLDGFRSINVRDQEYEKITGNDPVAYDGRTWTQAWIGLKLPYPVENLRLVAMGEFITRTSRLRDAVETRMDARATAGVWVEF